jgi:hypothetical protein
MRAERLRRSLQHSIRIVACAGGLVIAIPLAAACVIQDQTASSARAVCTVDDSMIDGSVGITRVRLEARFDGFHDDSLVDMVLSMDGAAVRCDPHDSVELSGESGEEGEVTLFCSVGLPSTGGSRRTLVALLRFRHAELSGVRLAPTPAPAR